jgi:hypothetical protein
MIYLASSWRNELQPQMVATLRAFGHSVYDFREPKLHQDGFHWSEVLPSYVKGSQSQIEADDYLEALEHDRATEGFTFDFEAMNNCDTCVLLLPCGASAHLEAGWFSAQEDRRLAIFIPPIVQPELMYKMADAIFFKIEDLLEWLGEE